VSDTRNVRLTVAYDGTDFRGFAESDGVRTVMGELRRAVETVVRSPVELAAAGRTDAGVHGWGQVVSGDLPAATDLRRLERSVNGLCAPDLSVRDVAWAEPSFSARFSATGRTYRYHVWNDPVPNPLLARTTWHVAQHLDVPAMDDAARSLLGEHDFSSFCRRPKGDAEVSLVRRVLAADWSEPRPSLLELEITATAFCHQMVRSITGLLVDVGRGRRTPAEVTAALEARDRSSVPNLAPPHGLTLWSVTYD
jgi:tRNA pseudouridine38-40 synthase